MGTFTLTTKARADLKSIAIYTQRKWGKEQRKIYIRQFDDTFHMLSKTPRVGTECDYIKTGYRKFPVTSHIVFYRGTSETSIEIVRILHKNMDARERLVHP
ncbi:type II toxin-antitoxin system RelE/ParE family toxin [Alkalimarinus alittae]|uniref:Toxin n=1 Tax=Alkalimarinus alittae TaxID=2961619 RepID=A0ABY6N5G3_9ALTE|nr:type II toxin-antitoxin system RelE/ParE family toxin [Alkalimarinus alittae]UZE97319.1 type II toxin-antitoxin system RelE/ParE family toxin [Alkalimarinus alittae]